MKIGFFLSIFIIFFSQSWGQTTCSPLVGYCSYYKCASRIYGCSKQDYFEFFGQKYCRYFETSASHFTASGQVFLHRVAQCLQIKLEIETKGLTCSNAKFRAAQHHVDCYLGSGFCQLSLPDQYRIFHAILRPVLLDRTFQSVARKITHSCHSF